MMTVKNNLSMTKTVYTEKGNKYEKTRAGRAAGVLSGAVIGGQHLKDFSKVADLILQHDELVKSKNAAAATKAAALADAKPGFCVKYITETELPAFVSKFLKSKTGKAAVAACGAMLVALAGIAFGGLIDKVVNKISANKADKLAEQKEAIIKEYEASNAKNN